jgi:hypothetical protein
VDVIGVVPDTVSVRPIGNPAAYAADVEPIVRTGHVELGDVAVELVTTTTTRHCFPSGGAGIVATVSTSPFVELDSV